MTKHLSRTAACLLAAGLLLPASLPAQQAAPDKLLEQQWTTLGSDKDGSYFFDVASVRRIGHVARFVMKLVPAAGGRTSQSIVQELDLDCAGQTVAFQWVRAVGAGGELIEAGELQPKELQGTRLRSDPVSKAIYGSLCPGAKPLPAGE